MEASESKLARLPTLSVAEECNLARRWQQHGDVAARNKLIEANARFVVSVAHKLGHHGRSRDDLIQEGMLGLMHAANKFDPERGIPFGRYAWHWVRAEMTEHVMRDWAMVSGGSGVLRTNRFFTLLKHRRQALAESGSEEHAVEVAATEMHQTPETIRTWLQRIDHRDSSMSSPMHCDLALSGRTPEDLVEYAEHISWFMRELNRAIETLSQRQQQVVWRIMDAGDEDVTLQAIGDELGLTRERIRQLRNQAFKLIRQHMKVAA